jgi:hypothetical protein
MSVDYDFSPDYDMSVEYIAATRRGVEDLPPKYTLYPKKILMLFHGTKHLLRDSSILAKLGVPFTIEIVNRITTIDINPDKKPTIVADLELPLTPEQLQYLGKFDLITSEYPPFVVYNSKELFDNVVNLLEPGGQFAFWPGLLTKSKYPHSPSSWIIPLSESKDMKARTKMGCDIIRQHPELVSFTKKNKLLIFTKA